MSYKNDLAETQEARQEPPPHPPTPHPPKQGTTCGDTLGIYKVSIFAS